MAMNRMVIRDVTIIDNRLECTYTVDGDWKKYFKNTDIFFTEYSKTIDKVPKSVAVIPFLCNVLPLSWICDAEVILDDIDKDFFESIEEFQQGYISMYPELTFKGRVIPKNVIDNRQEDLNKTAAFFSGGVDAYHTLISHIEEHPTLVTLWGADIAFEDLAGWNLVSNHIQSVANNSNLDCVLIKTSFRRFLDEGLISEYVLKITGNSWWYGFQHGVGIIGHMAPYAYQYKIKTTYIASSLTEEDNTTCASDPSIDNYVRFCGSQIIHDGYKYSRQDKVNRICEYSRRTNTPIQLRVCWESKGGSNCCHCEKCHLTIICLLAGKNDPREFGFNYVDEEFADMMKEFRMELHFVHPSCIVLYKVIQNEFHKNYDIEQLNPSLRWFYSADFNKVLSSRNRFIYRVLRKLKNIYRLNSA